jgi:hypothetical protein
MLVLLLLPEFLLSINVSSFRCGILQIAEVLLYLIHSERGTQVVTIPMDNLTLADLEYRFYGGGTAEKYEFLKTAYEGGIDAWNVLEVASGNFPANSVGSEELAQIDGWGVMGRFEDLLGNVQVATWAQ